MNRCLLRAWPCAAFVAVALALLCSAGDAAPAAGDMTALLAPVRAFAAAFDARGAYPSSAFTPNCSVLDDFAPYVWTGPGAPARWFAALVGTTPAERRATAAIAARIVFAAPEFARVARGHAYLVVPGTLTWMANGKPRTQHGRWTLAEVRVSGGWRIASQAWAIVDGSPDDE